MSNIEGYVASGFEAVQSAFETNFESNGDVGATFCVYKDGEIVVDLAGGTHPDGVTPYRADQLQLVYSTTKGATALCAHILAERGDLDFDAPVANYWPEFAQQGKGEITVATLISHQAGLVDVDDSLTIDDVIAWDPLVEALAAAKPMWEPGTNHGYHAITFGWLVGELVRRISGKSLGTFFADEVATPLGIDFTIGTKAERHDKIIPIIPMGLPPGVVLGDGPEPSLIELLNMLMGPGNLLGRALTAPNGALGDLNIWNEPRMWEAEIPAANGIANARAVAKMYAAMIGEVDGVRLLGEEALGGVTTKVVGGPDAVMMLDIPFSLGFMLDSAMSKFGSATAFGHYGAGGSLGAADPANGIAYSYVMDKMELGIAGDPRTSGLIDAVYESI